MLESTLVSMFRCPSPHFGENVTILAVPCDGVSECQDGVEENGCQTGEDWVSQVQEKAQGGDLRLKLYFWSGGYKKTETAGLFIWTKNWSVMK